MIVFVLFAWALVFYFPINGETGWPFLLAVSYCFHQSFWANVAARVRKKYLKEKKRKKNGHTT